MRNKANGRFEPGESGNLATRFQPGVSGNPVGKPRARRQFEEALGNALAGENPAERAHELSELVWNAARKGEPWAITLLLARLAPEPLKVKMEVSRGPDEVDFSRLSYEQIEQLERIFEQIVCSTELVEPGEGSAATA